MPDEITSSPCVRLLELLLVTASTFASSIALSFYLLFSHANINAQYADYFSIRILDQLINVAMSLALLGYVLWRQGRTFASLGFSFHWKDALRSLWVFLLAGSVTWLCRWVGAWGQYFLTGHAHYARHQNVGFLHSHYGSPHFFLLLLYACVNPFHEELPVRAFLMTEVRALSGRWRWAILASVFVQVSYHLYQGLGAALGYVPLFLIFAVYYARTGRIWPVILAHLYFDVEATFANAM